MTAQDYPFVQNVITDSEGQICQVVINWNDYQRLLEALEDEGLYQAMIEVQNEIPLSLEEALTELEEE